jgi:hypothetical protein
MVNYRTFQISDNLFWGFKSSVNIDHYTNSDDIVLEVKNRLKAFLKQNNLLELADKVDEKVLSAPDIKTINASKKTDTLYICMCVDHNH